RPYEGRRRRKARSDEPLMKTLLVALGILAAFVALFWLEWYYRNSGSGKEGGDSAPSGPDGDEPDSRSEPG
ncbi:MAG TPA: hypothetical protein VLG45_00175, partial [Thermodesulfobacteriota bacterium]|nr:hypothetical protein [Thermodesulfobacteriota bacterium]